MKTVVAAALVLLCSALPARAQAVKLRFHDGLVTLSTQNAPLRAVLTEWARLGGATIVNAERVAGVPVTLELNAVPERQALDVLLRSVAGYMAATRPAGAQGVALYNRIVILPTSSAPRPAAAPTPGFQQPRPMVPQPRIQLEPEPGDEPIVEEQPEPDDQMPVNPIVRPRNVPPGVRFPQVEPTPNVEPEEEPADEQPADAPANPFGIPAGATSRPGVVAPVPQQQTPRRTQPDPEP